MNEINGTLLKKELLVRNPLRLLGKDGDERLPKGSFGAVVARAGVGKTALMVQMALCTLLKGKNVLHISLTDPVQKVSLWYEEVFRNMSSDFDSGHMARIWEEILIHRFIMTFQADQFSVPKLTERLTDLTEQGIFYPQVALVDGLNGEEVSREFMEQFKDLAKEMGLRVWFALRSHRHETPELSQVPASMAAIGDLFETVIGMQPEGQRTQVRLLKGEGHDQSVSVLVLDPATMLIQDTTAA
ncbi:MAG: AAA family ATPase [Desulfobacterales bacterium]